MKLFLKTTLFTVVMPGTFAVLVLIASPISSWLEADVSVLCTFLGMQLGWAVSWVFARRVRTFPWYTRLREVTPQNEQPPTVADGQRRISD